MKMRNSDPDFYYNFLVNLDSTNTTDDWRRLFCGRNHNATQDSVFIYKHDLGFWGDIFPTLKNYVLGDRHSNYFSYFIMRAASYGLVWGLGEGQNEPFMRVANWFWDKLYDFSSKEIMEDFTQLSCA